MATVEPQMVSEYAQRDGYNAARALQPIQSVEEYLQTHPEIANGDDSDKSTYRSTFRSRYQQTINEMGDAGLTKNGKTPQQLAEEAAAAEANKKTIEEWEQETNIPSWSITQAAAARLNAEIAAWDKGIAQNSPFLATAEGKAWNVKRQSFYVQWNMIVAAIRSQVGTPSGGMADVRKARTAYNTLVAEGTKLAGQKVSTYSPPATQVKPGTPPSPLAAKATIPGWGIFAALAAVAGGVFLMFRKKKPEGPKALPQAGGVR